MFANTISSTVAPASTSGRRRVECNASYKPSPGSMASVWYGPDRPTWLNNNSSAVPSYLTGEFPGDYGWDTMGLSKNPATFETYRQIEIQQSRWAMLGVVGCITPEIMAKSGVPIAEPRWFMAGSQILKDGGINYAGYPELHTIDILPALWLQVVLMGVAEAARANGGFGGDKMDVNYPGGVFDPLGIASNDPDVTAELKVKELKNGRLAMVSWFGYAVQGIQNGKGPIEAVEYHLQNPWTNNGFVYAQKLFITNQVI